MKVVRLAQALVAIGHAAVAIVVLALQPRGFPVLHPRFLTNPALPLALLGWSIGCVALFASHPRTAAKASIAYPTAWLGLALGCACAFPKTGGSVALFAGGLAVAFSLVWRLNARTSIIGRRELAPFAALSGCIGFAVPFCWRPGPAGTVPSQEHRFERGAERRSEPDSAVERGAALRVDANDRRIQWTIGRLNLDIRPMLEFYSRSPDGFWTIFAPPRMSAPAPFRATVDAVSATELRVDAFSNLEAPVHSHLNSFTTVVVRGHSRLALRFSPCPETSIDVVHADYPFGAPARFAYLDEHGTFRVVQAADAEKGPFTTLAAGSLRREESLTVTLLELSAAAPRPIAEIELEHWARQLSTSLSPTAGFGVAENAIEFGLASPSSSSSAHVTWTLASTSVGRGWDTVTHAPGLYRNRMRVRVVQ